MECQTNNIMNFENYDIEILEDRKNVKVMQKFNMVTPKKTQSR